MFAGYIKINITVGFWYMKYCEKINIMRNVVQVGHVEQLVQTER